MALTQVNEIYKGDPVLKYYLFIGPGYVVVWSGRVELSGTAGRLVRFRDKFLRMRFVSFLMEHFFTPEHRDSDTKAV